MTPSIKVPLYKIEGKPGLHVARCNCTSGNYVREFGKRTHMVVDFTPDLNCEKCGLFFDLFPLVTLDTFETFVSWAYSTPERGK